MIFGPPGSGSFHHKAKIAGKTLISTVLWLLNEFWSLKNDVNVPLFRIRIRMFLGLPDPHPDPLVRGMDQRIWVRIRIRTKMSRIHNTVFFVRYLLSKYRPIATNLRLKIKVKWRDPIRTAVHRKHICYYSGLRLLSAAVVGSLSRPWEQRVITLIMAVIT